MKKNDSDKELIKFLLLKNQKENKDLIIDTIVELKKRGYYTFDICKFIGYSRQTIETILRNENAYITRRQTEKIAKKRGNDYVLAIFKQNKKARKSYQ